MASLNKGEYSQEIYVDFLTDISLATGLTVIIQPELSSGDGETVYATGASVTLGTIDIVVGDEVYNANEYIKYTIEDGDLSKSGTWRVKGIAEISSLNKIISDYKRFTVLD